MTSKSQGKKALMVVAPMNFRDEELLQTREVLAAEGVEVKVAAREVQTCRGMLGATVMPDMMLRDARALDFDAIVIVGGAGSQQYLWNDHELSRLVRDAKQQGRILAAICLSGVVLAKAGVLKGIEATVFPARDSLKALKDGGARHVQRSVVVSGKVITAEGPEASREFGKKIVDALSVG